ncbi:hypothetical protein [Blastopirellula marina]|uniref:Uncharacterized protein n=1 Tax=Blastopirellula marina TaxID=124 RepID=A0A2S8FHG7_9BACT|nr:hypothetical protein [Blastopirellula marina]PQO31638.1 hypothetical protein C5Y98_19680 [Blastopirellula marina]PTL42945.1 hypothetical protein C5Y97_19690 [Blastopirellula marina]
MLTFDLYSKESRLFALGCFSLVLLGCSCISLLVGLPRAEDGTLLSPLEGPWLLVLPFVALFFILPTCNRRTQVDLANREIVARDYIFFVLPIWRRRFRFVDVTGIEYARRLRKPLSDDDSPRLTVYLKRGKRRLAIMERSSEDEFAPCLLSAWQLGKQLGRRVKKVETTTSVPGRKDLAKRTFDRCPKSLQRFFLLAFSLATAFLGYGLFFGATVGKLSGDGPIDWGLLAFFLIMLLTVMLLTYNRRTAIYPNQRRIVVRDYLLLFLPFRTYPIEFKEVTGVEFYLRPPPFYDEFYRTVTVSLVTDRKKLAIMDRQNDYQLDSHLAAARELAQLVQCPFTDASPATDKTSDVTAS